MGAPIHQRTDHKFIKARSTYSPMHGSRMGHSRVTDRRTDGSLRGSQIHQRAEHKLTNARITNGSQIGAQMDHCADHRFVNTRSTDKPQMHGPPMGYNWVKIGAHGWISMHGAQMCHTRVAQIGPTRCTQMNQNAVQLQQSTNHGALWTIGLHAPPPRPERMPLAGPPP